jgi:hypothetical protein
MLGGISFIVVSLLGGFASSLGSDLYRAFKGMLTSGSGFPFSLPQIAFLAVGLIGIGLLISGLIDSERGYVKKRS